MRGPFVDPLAIAMARKLGGGGGGVKPSGEIAIDKNGTYDVTQYASANVNVSGGGGGGGDSSKPVRFLDYDGMVVQSYTAEEFAALEAMPENPDHSGDEIPLTAQGWNWSLADAKAYVAKYGALEVGQMYITTDGKTHIKIYIDPDTPTNRRVMGVRFAQSVANGVIVDWGDGTTPESFSETSITNHDHTYAQTGWYDITLNVTSGTITFTGTNGSSSIIGFNGQLSSYKRNAPREVRLGEKLSQDAIGYYAFDACYALTSVTIPNGIISIGDYAFRSCYSLASITIPNGVTSIRLSVFQGCYSLGNITLPNGITSISERAFSDCKSLTSIIIPDSVTSIGVYAFNGCNTLSGIIIPSSVTNIGGSAFYECSCLNDFTIPDGVASISGGMLQRCYNLTGVTIPNSVTSIKGSAFESCTAITSITIPDSVTSIESRAYYSCTGLTTITIPAYVNSIGGYAFAVCYSVSEYHLLPTTPPTIQSSTFSNIASDCIIYVPAASVEDYKAAANWSALASKIQAEPA